MIRVKRWRLHGVRAWVTRGARGWHFQFRCARRGSVYAGYGHVRSLHQVRRYLHDLARRTT